MKLNNYQSNMDLTSDYIAKGTQLKNRKSTNIPKLLFTDFATNEPGRNSVGPHDLSP